MRAIVVFASVVVVSVGVVFALAFNALSAQAVTDVPRWEYFEVVAIRYGADQPPIVTDGNAQMIDGDYENYQSLLNHLGEEGWELITADVRQDQSPSSAIFFFKRPLQ